VCCTKGDDFVCCNTKEDDIKRLLRDQLEIYSYQFKQAPNTFGKDQIALSGKVGGMKDDLCICLQLGVYWSRTKIVHKSVL